jgi:hypothetical protein
MVRLMREARQSLAGELDGKFPDALRNVLFGDFGEDLFTRNAFRSLEVGMQPYKQLAKCFGVTPDARVRFTGVLLLRRARAVRAAQAADGQGDAADLMTSRAHVSLIKSCDSQHCCTEWCLCACSPDEPSLAPQRRHR